MGRLGKRRRLARGIYEDGTGRSAVSIGKERRFPPHTPIAVMRAWQDEWRRTHPHKRGNRAAAGTLTAAIERWEREERHLVSFISRRAELRAWCALYPNKYLTAISSADVRRAISTWHDAGVKAKTIRNRLWTLKHLFHLTFGPRVETPVDEVEPPARERQVINPTPASTILAVYAKLLEFERTGRLRDAKTRARFMVRAATGRRPSEIMRAQPDDVDLERRIWRVRDAKGGWSEGLYLNDDMITAWRTFVDAHAWGFFRTESMAIVLRAAGWPEDVRPYNLRHSIGIDLSEAGHDLDDIGPWLGHKPGSRMTREHYVPVLRGRMQRLSETIDGRLQGWKVS